MIKDFINIIIIIQIIYLKKIIVLVLDIHKHEYLSNVDERFNHMVTYVIDPSIKPKIT